MSHNHTQFVNRIIVATAVAAMGLVMAPTGAHASTGVVITSSSSAKTAPGQPAFGDKGPHVVAVQTAIIRNGFSLNGGATGVFNKSTQRALKSFQKVVGLKVTGVVDSATAKVLKVAAATTTTVQATTTVAPTTTTVPAVVYPLTTTTLPVRGAKGEAVVAVQKALKAAGLEVKGGIDGAFGSGTTSTISTFQTSKGLSVTGVLDIPTAVALALVAPIAAPAPAPAPAAVSIASAPTLLDSSALPVRGAKSDAVRTLQNALIGAGIEVKGGADGVFGGATFIALQKYQTANALTVTGTLTTQTAVKLGLVAPPAVTISVFPVQGLCSYENTWHAPRGTDRKHLGVDIIAKEGNLLYAVADGTITKLYTVGTDKLAGNGVRLTTADGTYFFYGHMQKLADGITIGTKVKAGQVVGYVGKTGDTNTPHLHIEVHPLGGEAIDPTPVMAAVDACSVTAPLAAPAA